MKRKDLTYLIIAGVILVVVGILGYGQLHGGGAATVVTVEKVPAVPDHFNTDLLKQLNDPTKLRDFAPTIDLSTGLNNPHPFGPL